MAVLVNLQNPSGDKLVCQLCPHFCRLGKGKTGICGVRRNNGEKIELLTYGVISALALDPIEKKPLYHFFPGSNILSVGSYGCNMRCDFCQNYHISQNISGDLQGITAPESLLKQALASGNNIGMAFTYNEPAIWFEYIHDVAVLIKQNSLYNIMVTNGFIAPEALDNYIEFIDAFNVDLKAFSNDMYRKLTGADLEPVKSSLRRIAGSGRHLEITTLIITGQNDSGTDMKRQAEWMADELGDTVPLHLSRYFPMFRRDDPVTPESTLFRLYETASKYLKHVYIGNSRSGKGQDTRCPSCDTLLTRRSGYHTQHINVDKGNCNNCGKEVYRYFTSSSL